MCKYQCLNLMHLKLLHSLEFPTKIKLNVEFHKALSNIDQIALHLIPLPLKQVICLTIPRHNLPLDGAQWTIFPATI